MYKGTTERRAWWTSDGRIHRSTHFGQFWFHWQYTVVGVPVTEERYFIKVLKEQETVENFRSIKKE